MRMMRRKPESEMARAWRLATTQRTPSRLQELETEVDELREALYRYHLVLDDLTHGGAFTAEEVRKFHLLCELYGAWFP